MTTLPAHGRRSAVFVVTRGIAAKCEFLNIGWRIFRDLLKVLALRFRQNRTRMWGTVRSKLERGTGWSHRSRKLALWAQTRGRAWGALGSLDLDLPREYRLRSRGALTPHEPPVAALCDMPLLIFVLFRFGFFFALG